MTSAIRNPHDCGHSINHRGTFICKLSCTPCSLHFDKKCELGKIDSFVDALAKCIWGDKTE